MSASSMARHSRIACLTQFTILWPCELYWNPFTSSISGRSQRGAPGPPRVKAHGRAVAGARTGGGTGVEPEEPAEVERLSASNLVTNAANLESKFRSLSKIFFSRSVVFSMSLVSRSAILRSMLSSTLAAMSSAWDLSVLDSIWVIVCSKDRRCRASSSSICGMVTMSFGGTVGVRRRSGGPSQSGSCHDHQRGWRRRSGGCGRAWSLASA